MKNILIFIALALCFAVHFGESQKGCYNGCESFGPNPKCIKKGKTWQKDCVTYKCQDKNNILTLAPDKIQCQTDDPKPKCINKGKTYQKGCVTYKCQVNDKKTTIAPDKIQCQTDDPKPKCIKKGNNWTKDCITYQCVVNGYKVKWNQIKAECKIGNTCYREGQSFPYTINGVRYNKCKCQINGKASKISCTG